MPGVLQSMRSKVSDTTKRLNTEIRHQKHSCGHSIPFLPHLELGAPPNSPHATSPRALKSEKRISERGGYLGHICALPSSAQITVTFLPPRLGNSCLPTPPPPSPALPPTHLCQVPNLDVSQGWGWEGCLTHHTGSSLEVKTQSPSSLGSLRPESLTPLGLLPSLGCLPEAPR